MAVDAVSDAPAADGRSTLLRSHRTRWTVAATLTAYLVLTLAMALTKRPWVDEAWFAVPALNLLTNGVLATTNLETAGTWLNGLDRYTYWITPLHLVTQAGWYAIFGFGVLSLRALSMVWGLLALLSILAIVDRLTGQRRAALLAMAIVATDYTFIRAAGDGRMDMMGAALGFMGIACYLLLRQRHMGLAILVGHTCGAASLLTHPHGLLPVAGLGALTLFLDRGQLRWRHVGLAAMPYVAGLSAWGVYIAQDPHLFLTQFGGNAAGEPWKGIGGWLASVWNTYAAAYGLRTHWAGPAVHLRALVLLAYLSGVVGVLSIGTLRRQRGVRGLLLVLGAYFVLMSLPRRASAHEYLVHIVPIYASVLAVWLAWSWQNRTPSRRLVGAAVAGLLVLQAGGVALRAYADTYRRQFMPVVQFLQMERRPGDLIMGSAELGFALGFTAQLMDDTRLGFHSGRHPEFIVIDERYQSWITDLLAREPDVQQHVVTLLAERYEKRYDQVPYQVYRCRQHFAPQSVTP